MKNKIKYIISPIMILSLAFVFMPIINIGNWKVSMKNLAQITFAKIDEPYILQQIQSYMQEYVKPYVYLGMILVVLTIFVAVMVLVFKSNVSYIIGMIGEVAMMAIMIMLYVAVNSGIDTIKTMVSYFGMGNVVKVNYLPAIFWTVMQIASIILCIVGIVVKDTTAERRRVRTISRRTVMTSGEVRPGTGWEQGGRQQTDYINRDSWGAREEQNNIAEEQKYQMNDRQEFYGAIIGCQGEYIGKALELTEKEPVFVEDVAGVIGWTRQRPEEGQCVAVVYYVPEYGEYCVTPSQRMTVFLSSGQPLGAGRNYYLPRTTEIYIQLNGETSRRNFKLA